MPTRKLFTMLDKHSFRCYITTMNNEPDQELIKILDSICAGVEVPTDEESEAAKDVQQGDSFIL